jgi:hypothetical protein
LFDDNNSPRIQPAIPAHVFNEIHAVALAGLVALVGDLADMSKITR